jgi:two-component system KDP operon response regulator KdpE
MRGNRQAEILLVENTASIGQLQFTLEDAGYVLRVIPAGQLSRDRLPFRAPDLLLLDLDEVNDTGPEPVRTLRSRYPTPLLVLSGLCEEPRKVAALDAGADDYLTRPFGDAELLARVRALLRRPRAEEPDSVYRFGPIELDLTRRRVLSSGQPLKLTATEFALLQLLVVNRDNVLTHREILRELWGPQAENYVHYLRTYMMRLRRKFGPDVNAAGYFQTESSVGYRFVSDPVK